MAWRLTSVAFKGVSEMFSTLRRPWCEGVASFFQVAFFMLRLLQDPNSADLWHKWCAASISFLGIGTVEH
jgi:hypothetical protein